VFAALLWREPESSEAALVATPRMAEPASAGP
jgi:hypothetical protein